MIKKYKKIKRRSNTDLVCLAVHQLKKPLSSMKLSLKMLIQGNFGEIKKEQKDIIEKLYKNNESLIYLVDDLLDLAKIEDGEKSSNFKLVDINSLIDSLINSDQEEILNKKIKFQYENSDMLPKVKLNEEKISIALKNIFDNAIKYTGVGGSVVVSLKQDKNNLQIKVLDSGIGIPENQKNKLFGKFFRANNALKMGIIGTGLGLFISKSIVESFNGKIWFESKEGSGSAFYISLPIG